jgi:hypothetical protein
MTASQHLKSAYTALHAIAQNVEVVLDGLREPGGQATFLELAERVGIDLRALNLAELLLMHVALEAAVEAGDWQSVDGRCSPVFAWESAR